MHLRLGSRHTNTNYILFSVILLYRKQQPSSFGKIHLLLKIWLSYTQKLPKAKELFADFHMNLTPKDNESFNI